MEGVIAVSLESGILLFNKFFGEKHDFGLGGNVDPYQLSATLFAFYKMSKEGFGENNALSVISKGSIALYFNEEIESQILIVAAMDVNFSAIGAQNFLSAIAELVVKHGLSTLNSPRQSTIKAIHCDLDQLLVDIVARLYEENKEVLLMQSSFLLIVKPDAFISGSSLQRMFRQALNDNVESSISNTPPLKESETLLPSIVVNSSTTHTQAAQAAATKKRAKGFVSWMRDLSKTAKPKTNAHDIEATKSVSQPPVASGQPLPASPKALEVKPPLHHMWIREGAQDDLRGVHALDAAQACIADHGNALAENSGVLMEMRIARGAALTDECDCLHMTLEHGLYVIRSSVCDEQSAQQCNQWVARKNPIKAQADENVPERGVASDFCFLAKLCLEIGMLGSQKE